jgi:hypothetical protein
MEKKNTGRGFQETWRQDGRTIMEAEEEANKVQTELPVFANI